MILRRANFIARHVDNSGASVKLSLCCCFTEELRQLTLTLTVTIGFGMVTKEISSCVQFHAFMSRKPSSSMVSSNFLRQIRLVGKILSKLQE